MHEIAVGASVECRDGSCGQSTAVIVNPVNRTITHIVVKVSDLPAPGERLVPAELVEDTSHDLIRISSSKAEIAGMQPFIETRYIAAERNYSHYQGGEWQAPYATAAMSSMVPVEQERVPPGELAVHRGDQVEATDGHVGTMEEFLIDAESGEITHLVLQQEHIWGKCMVTIPVSGIESAHGGVVYLNLDRKGVQTLPCIPIKRHYARGDSSGNLEMVAYVFDGVDRAEETLDSLEEQLNQQAGAVKIHNAAVLTKNDDGKGSARDIGDINVKKSRILGAVAGGVVGLLAGPVGALIGAAAGIGAGGFAAKKIDISFSNDFLTGLESHLQPGSSALIVVVDRERVDELSGLIAGAKGVILQQALSEEMVEQLKQEDKE